MPQQCQASTILYKSLLQRSLKGDDKHFELGPWESQFEQKVGGPWFEWLESEILHVLPK